MYTQGPIDLNGAEQQRNNFDLIPTGQVVRVVGVIRPGGVSPTGQPPQGAPGPDDHIATASQSSDAVYLDWEYTVMGGPYDKRKLWGNTTIAGGKVDENNNSKAAKISHSTFRAMVDSALGLLPTDDGEAARQKRVIPSYASLSGITFFAKVGLEKDKTGSYPDKNKLALILTPDMPDYPKSEDDLNKKVVPPAGAGGPAWGSQAATTAKPATPAWGNPAAQQPAAQPAAEPATGFAAAPAIAAQAVAATNGAAAVPAWARR